VTRREIDVSPIPRLGRFAIREGLVPVEHQLHMVEIIDRIHPRTCQPLLA